MNGYIVIEKFIARQGKLTAKIETRHYYYHYATLESKGFGQAHFFFELG
ncbi:hypothetical protein [Rhizobium miluonense]